jgi:hypothetical protein
MVALIGETIPIDLFRSLRSPISIADDRGHFLAAGISRAANLSQNRSEMQHVTANPHHRSSE